MRVPTSGPIPKVLDEVPVRVGGRTVATAQCQGLSIESRIAPDGAVSPDAAYRVVTYLIVRTEGV